MPERVLEWVRAFGGEEETNMISFCYGDLNWYAFNNPRNGQYGWNLSAYEKYKDEESVTMFIAAHEAGHNYDKAFNRFGHFKKSYIWYLLIVLSGLITILSMPLHWFCATIWFVAAEMGGMIIVADVYYDEYEWTAEKHALDLLGPGVVLHASLILGLIAKELRQDKEKEEGKEKKSDDNFHLFRTKVYKKTVLTALNNLDIDFLGDELNAERKL